MCATFFILFYLYTHIATWKHSLRENIIPPSFNKSYFVYDIVHSALKLEKSEISKVQKHIICIFKKGKKSIFAPEKSLKLPKM